MRNRIIVLTASLAVIYGVFAGCDTGSQNSERSIITVSSLNNNSPGLVDVLCQGDSIFEADGTTVKTSDDGIVPTWIPIIFFNKPYSGLNPTESGLPYGDYVVERYTIDWTRTDGGTPLPSTDDQTSIIVPSDEEAFGYIRLVSFDSKTNPLIFDLNYLGARAGQIDLMTANITFFGREAGTDRVTEFQARLSVQFLDIISTECDENEFGN